MKTLFTPTAMLLITLLIHLSMNNHQLQADDKMIINLVTEDAGVLNYIDPEDGQVKGYSVELIKLIMLDAGLDYKIRVLPWARAYKEANTKENTLIFSIGRISSRENNFKWVGQLVPMEYALYALSKNLPNKNLTLEEIKKKMVGVQRNDLRHQYLSNNNFNNLIFTRNYEHTQKLLLRERIDYFIASLWEIAAFKKKNNLSNSDVVSVLNIEELKIGLYYAFSKQTDDEIVEQVKRSYQKLVDDGTFIKIMKPILLELEQAKQNN